MKTRAVFYTSRGGLHRGRLLLSTRFSRGFLGLSLSAIFAVLATTSAFATDPDPELVAAGKTVASKAYVDTKQDKITTGLVTFRDPEESINYSAPALVSYGTGTNNNDGVLGNKIGVLGRHENSGGLGSWEFVDIVDDSEAGYLDNFVPTVRAVAIALQGVWNSMPNHWTAFSWNNNTFPGLIDAYNIDFGGNGNWPNTPNYLVPAETFVKGLALKQKKIPVQDTNLVPGQQVGNSIASSVIAPTATPGVAQQVALWDADGWDPASWDINTYFNNDDGYNNSDRTAIRMSIPTVGAVEAALHDIQANMPSSWTAFSWNNNTFPGLIDAYNIDFGGNGNWPNTPNYLVPADTFVKGIARKQNIIPAKAQNSDFYSVLTDTSADGEVGKLQILTAGYMQANGESFASWVPNDNEIVTAGAIHRELLNNWQPIIPASMASNEISQQTLSLPSFVVANVLTNGASPTLSSGTYGIITQDNIEDYAGLWSEFALFSNMDRAIPTVKAVANAITRLEWNSRIQDAIDSYRTQFFASGDGVWWFSESDKLINTPVFSKGLALKQNKLAAKASDARAQAITRSTAGNTSSAYITEGGSVGLTTRSGAPAVINYVNGTVATDGEFTTFTNGTFGTATGDTLTNNKNAIKNALVSLELLKDVYSALHTEITSAVPTGTPNTIANYNANGALGAGIATYDASGTYNSANDSGKIATAAAVETRQKKKVCGGYKPGYENNPDYCWLWTFPE